MSQTERWLRSRVGNVPEKLLERMTAALPPAGEVIPLELAEGAVHLYASVAASTGGREDALPLLAADALLTHAFEAQAEIDPDGLDELIVRCERELGKVVP